MDLSTLTHEEVEQITAKDGSPCCFRTESENWWLIIAPDLEGFGGINCHHCARYIERVVEQGRSEGEVAAQDVEIRRVPTRQQQADARAYAYANIGT